MSSSSVIEISAPDTSLCTGNNESTPVKAIDKEDLSDTQGANLSPSLSSEKSRKNSSRDDFWDALSSHYDYLMDDALIVTCREASSDLSWDDAEEEKETFCWSFTQFIENFKRLHDSLHHLQVSMEDGNKENILEEQKKVSYLCKHFNEQGHKLSRRYPDMRDEVHRHLNLLNNKWEAVEQSINPNRPEPAENSIFDEIITRMRCLRRCLRELENRLCPVTLSAKWSSELLEETYKEQQVLQREIEAKGKYVTSLLKLFEHLDGDAVYRQHSPLRWDPERLQRVAENLQRHWHSIWLQSLECQYVVKTLMNKGCVESKLDCSFSEEPLKKYPRLSEDWDGPLTFSNEFPVDMNTKSDDDAFSTDPVVKKTNRWLQNYWKNSSVLAAGSRESRGQTNDKGVMVGSTSIAELKASCNGDIGKFEIVQDVGYSSETSAHFSNDEQAELSNTVFSPCDSSTFAKSVACTDQFITQSSSSLPIEKESSPKLFLAPDKYPSFNLKRHLFFSEDKPLTDSKFTKSVPGSFYRMTSLDPDVCSDLPDCSMSEMTHGQSSKGKEVCQQVSSEASPHDTSMESAEQDAVVSSSTDQCKVSSVSSLSSSPNSTLKRSKRVHRSVVSSDTSKVVKQSEKSKRTAKVREWLNTCQSDNVNSGEAVHEKANISSKDVVDSSCDASGEYTTESDCEKSVATDDVNNSLSLSQSFAGSVETVVPVAKEEANVQVSQVNSSEHSPSVRLRKKKKHSRDRPWSVIEGNQIPMQHARFTYSTSEGALNSMAYLHNERNTQCSKKLCSRKKRSSLTDMSVSSCPLMQTKGQKSVKISSKYNRHSDGSDGCHMPKEDYDFLRRRCSGSQSAEAAGKKEESGTANSSDHHSVSSCNSTSSRRRGHHKNRRRLKSSHSDGSAKHKSHSEGSSAERKALSCSGSAIVKVASKCNSNPSCTEDQSSVSDQVWDEYQDPPYLSEPYSEQTADEDLVRKLINFGDDYRAILGSHSDASSAKSICKPAVKSRFRCVPFSLKDSAHHADLPNSGSDSDTEDFHNMLATSLRALHFVRNCLKENVTKESFAFSSELAELVATCQTNLCHLLAIHDELTTNSSSQTFSSGDLQKLEDLMKEWEILQEKLTSFSCQKKDGKTNEEHIQAAVLEVQSTMMAYKSELNAIWGCASESMSAISTSSDLEKNIQALQNGLATLQEMKGAVLSVSAKILRLSAESCSEAVFPLRDAAAKLYQQWEDVYELSTSQLTKLQSLQSRWLECSERDLEKHLETALQLQSPAKHDTSTHKFKEHFRAGELKTLCQVADFSRCARCGAKHMMPDFSVEEFLSCSPVDLKLKCDKANNTDDSDSESVVKSKSRLWRVLWASMPIHLALVISYCLSCLMEPQSCESMNNLEFSIFPHLRHYQGPPPV